MLRLGTDTPAHEAFRRSAGLDTAKIPASDRGTTVPTGYAVRSPMRQLLDFKARLQGWPPWQRYLGATVLSLLALLAHSIVSGTLQTFHLLLFFPAVMLSVLLFGRGAGVWATACSGALAAYFLFEPAGFAISDPGEAMALTLFIAVALWIVFTIAALIDHIDGLVHEAGDLRAVGDRAVAEERKKDLLLREMAHRTRNDLQAVCSMLHIQAREVDGAAKAVLAAAGDRIQIMARVQQRLIHDGAEASVDIGAFIADLCKDLQVSLVGLRPIALRADVESEVLPLARAVPVGLIVNELVTNALKYAFPDDRPGVVEVRLSREGDGLRLCVADDGVGLGESKPAGTGLGQRLVRSLVQQIGGTLSVQSDEHGTTCIVTLQ